MMSDGENLPPSQRVHDIRRIEAAMRRGVREALRQHKRAGNPIAVWRDGQVVWIPADEIVIEDEPEE